MCYAFSLIIPYLCPRPKNVIKEVAPSSIFVNFSDKNPGANFFAKGPQKKTLSDFLIFDMGTTTCFIANSLLSPLLHVKIHASVGYQRPSYAFAHLFLYYMYAYLDILMNEDDYDDMMTRPIRTMTARD